MIDMHGAVRGDKEIMAIEKRYPEDALTRECHWEELFDPEVVRQAQTSRDLQRPVKKSYGYRLQQYRFPMLAPVRTATIYDEPDYRSGWRDVRMDCTCRKNYCVHLAAALTALEKDHGPWIVRESEREYNERREREKFEEEKKVRAEEAARIGTDPIPAVEAFTGRKKQDIVLFDIEKALSGYMTTPYAVHQLKQMERTRRGYDEYVTVETSREGKKIISFRREYNDQFAVTSFRGVLTDNELALERSDVPKRSGMRYYYMQPEYEPVPQGSILDEYALILIDEIWDEADRESALAVTDGKALTFFRRIENLREAENLVSPQAAVEVTEKREEVDLLPRILVEEGDPVLSFKIGRAGERKYIVKNCDTLISAVREEKTLVLGKKDTLDFSKQDFLPGKVPVYNYIQRHRSKSYGNTYLLSLTGSRLDTFYDMYEGGECELVDKTNGIRDQLVRVGHMDIHFKLTADRLTDARGTFIGVSVSGFVPVLISGASHKYVLNTAGLSRISKEEKRVLDPFLEVADASGYFRFQVGTENFREFYYRTIPGLLENPYVEFIDHCEAETAPYLPPEPVFRFFLDLEDDILSLQGRVQYDDREFTLEPARPGTADGSRDNEQESRVRRAIERWLPEYSEDGGVWQCTIDSDDVLYDFLTAGLPSLEYYGTVNGSGAFRAYRVVPQPQLQVGVSVEAGDLLNISVLSKDIGSRELMDIYNSYKKRKRYHRLKSGDFVDLSDREHFREVESFLSQIDVSTTDFLHGKTQIPLYRALYLNTMLEAHEGLVSSRDRTYRAMIRSFKTVKDAEYETPPEMEDVLRPYQVYGYKWLRTLQETGFGGILADEMGLGKTLQMIAVFENDRLSGKNTHPSLVVCPASLVYNWQEEIGRFAPELRTVVVAGTTGSRKKLLGEPGAADVFITSYDLMKRDIALYSEFPLRNCVLDEAQYIKNTGAAVSKSVRLLKADHRFALTGTPIENRLSELWSIFDFLMPGFLYGKTEFERRFATPITKKQDPEMTAKLRSMTEPFILRRRKTEVLKDLPEKLEEVRKIRIEGEQRRVYDGQVIRMKGLLQESGSAGEEKIKILAELTKIRQICCDPSLLFEDYRGESAKREACMELIQSAIEGGHRILLFSQFVSMLELLEGDLREAGIEYYKIIGATSKEKRISLVRSFNEGNVPVFLISLKAGGTGLNLTGADVVIHYDPWWNLAAQNQATDRAHRIGQTRRVTVYKLIMKDTIEERIAALQDAKRDLAEAILEGGGRSLTELTPEELLALLD